MDPNAKAGYPHPSSVHGFDPAWPGELHHIISGWWFQTFAYFPSYMGCHPSHWRTHIFQDGYCTTNQVSIDEDEDEPTILFPPSMENQMESVMSNHNTRSPPWDCGKPNNKPCHYVTNHHWRSFYIIPFFGVYPIINQSRLGMVYLSHLPWLSHYSPISIHILLWISYIPLLLAFPD